MTLRNAIQEMLLVLGVVGHLSVEAAPVIKTIAWDRVIDYSTDPAWQPYSRPVPGDFNGDHWLDPALTTPDGHWLIDYGGFTATLDAPTKTVTYADKFGSFETTMKYVTDAQLAAAPAWAYMPVSGGTGGISFKVPDGITVPYQFISCVDPGMLSLCEGKYSDFFYPDLCVSHLFCSTDAETMGEYFTPLPEWIFGGMDVQALPNGFKWPDGQWGAADFILNESTNTIEVDWMDWPPHTGFGGINCRPVPADYDGDGVDDRAVQCATEWRIAYSNVAGWDTPAPNLPVNADGFRIVPAPSVLDPVPGVMYPGGVTYQDIQAIYEYYLQQIGCTHADGTPCTIFDLTTTKQVAAPTSTYPPPIGPYFPVCLTYWANHPLSCLNY